MSNQNEPTATNKRDHEAESVDLQRMARRHPAAGHIEAAINEAEELSKCYRLEGSAAMVTLKNQLKLALAELGGVSPSAKLTE